MQKRITTKANLSLNILAYFSVYLAISGYLRELTSQMLLHIASLVVLAISAHFVAKAQNKNTDSFQLAVGLQLIVISGGLGAWIGINESLLEASFGYLTVLIVTVLQVLVLKIAN